jgi:hypothetical protein
MSSTKIFPMSSPAAAAPAPSGERHALDGWFARQRSAWWRGLRPLLLLLLGLTVVDLAGTINALLGVSAWPPDDAPWLGGFWSALKVAQLGAAVVAGLSLAHAYSLPPEFILSHSDGESYAVYRRAVRGAVYFWMSLLYLLPPAVIIGVSLARALGDPFPAQSARLGLELCATLSLYVFCAELMAWLVLSWPRRGVAWHALPALAAVLAYHSAARVADNWRGWLDAQPWLPGGMYSLLLATAVIALPSLLLATAFWATSRRAPKAFIADVSDGVHLG